MTSVLATYDGDIVAWSQEQARLPAITRHDAAAIVALGQFNDGRARLANDILAKIEPALGTITTKLGDQVQRLEHAATNAGRHVSTVDRSIRTTAALGIGLACAAALVGAGISWGSLRWQRGEVDDLKAQRTALVAEIEADTAQVGKLKLRGAELEWTTCKVDGGTWHRDRLRQCIRMDRDLATQNLTFGTGADQYFVPQGY